MEKLLWTLGTVMLPGSSREICRVCKNTPRFLAVIISWIFKIRVRATRLSWVTTKFLKTLRPTHVVAHTWRIQAPVRILQRVNPGILGSVDPWIWTWDWRVRPCGGQRPTVPYNSGHTVKRMPLALNPYFGTSWLSRDFRCLENLHYR